MNCSAVVEALFESELFGHARGAFTGASENKPGMFEAADGGTLFLDEIGELPQAVQAKLLRVLETGEVQRVGSLQPRKVDVRIVAATNRDLRAEVDAGRFRSDLFYRLNVVELHVPPLRERREDIPYLTAAFVKELGGAVRQGDRRREPGGRADPDVSEWPGNVRELRNVLERACMLADGRTLTERDRAGRDAAPRGLRRRRRGERRPRPGGRRARSYRPRARGGSRQQAGRGQAARDQPADALSTARAPRPPVPSTC